MSEYRPNCNRYPSSNVDAQNRNRQEGGGVNTRAHIITTTVEGSGRLRREREIKEQRGIRKIGKRKCQNGP